MEHGVHRRILSLVRAGIPLEDISLITNVPLSAILYIIQSPLARAELARVG